MKFGGENWIGRSKYGIKFVERIKILGIIFSSQEDPRLIDDVINNKIKSMHRVCALWSRRNLSIIGKIIIIKTFMLSTITHIIQSIGIRPEKLKEINNLFFQFIWKPSDPKKC